MRRTSLTFAAKPVFFALAALGLVSSCAPDDNIGGGNGGDIAVPSVKIIPGESGEDYLTFTLAPENAAELRYLVVPASEQQYDAVGVMENGEEADASVRGEYTSSGLAPSTDYLVLAAARNSEGLTSLLASAEMSTDAHMAVLPEITLGNVSVDGTSATFSYTLEAAVSASYLCLASGDSAPDAETILSDGTALSSDATQETVEGLSYSTSYTIYAAAENADGYSEVASADFVTGDAPVFDPEVGDFYYSDGTWSSSSDAPVAGKTVIGVIFKTGPAESDPSDYSGAGIGQVKGFVVGLDNASYLVDEWWGEQKKTDFEWTVITSVEAGTSQDENDFAGYANTLAIQEFAQESYGGLAYSNLRAAYVAVNYAGADVEPVPVPENTTGWFFPSAGQMKAIYAAASEITASLETAGGTEVTGDFWSSTTVAGSTPVQAYCIHIQSGSISVEGLNQTRVWKVRPILAF